MTSFLVYNGVAFPGVRGGGKTTLLQQLIDDVHPPLYYFLLKIILDISHDSLVCARLFSAILFITFLWCGALFVRRNFGKKSALFYVFFLYLNPFMVQKATEIRMYMLASVFVVWSGMVTLQLLKISENGSGLW
ncbi:MAG: glycosyltransferase family 39 protein [bacterium]|nr:glycosyltransferase family 39 protein [bacterium]